MRTSTPASAIPPLLAVVVASCIAVPPTPAPAPSGAPGPASVACADADARALLALVNRSRADAGLAPLALDGRLQRAAGLHAADMARGDFMAHAGSDGSSPAGRVARAGYEWSLIAENVAAGPPDPAAVHRAWMDSPGHRANVLDGAARHLGVGHVRRADTALRHYWVTVFGDTDGGRAAAASC